MIVFLLAAILLILLFGAPLIFALIYGVAVVVWAILPWAALIVGLLFVVETVKLLRHRR